MNQPAALVDQAMRMGATFKVTTDAPETAASHLSHPTAYPPPIRALKPDSACLLALDESSSHPPGTFFPGFWAFWGKLPDSLPNSVSKRG